MRPAVGYLRSNGNTGKVMGDINNPSYGLTYSSTGMLQFNGSSYVFNGDINVLKGTMYFDGVAKTINGGNSANNINVSAGAVFQSQSSSTTAQNFTGAVSGAGQIFRSATQQWNVSGNWAGFTGTLNVGGSTNRLSITPSVTNVNMRVTGAANGTLSASTTNGVYDIGELSGAHQVTLNAGVTGVDWRIGALNTTTTFSGAFSGGILRKRGTGTLTINGNVTTTDQKIVEAGTLVLGNNACIQNVANAYNVLAGATLQFTLSAALTLNTAIANAGAMVVGGAFVLTAGNAFMDGLTGTASILAGSAIQIQTATYNSTAAWTINGTLSYSNFGATVTLGSLAGSGVINKQGATGASLTIGGNNASTTWSGTISGGGTLTLNKIGTGTLTMSGDSTAYTFNTFNINAGTVLVTGANALPQIGAIGTFIEVNNGGTLTLGVNMTGTRSIRVNAGGICNKGGFTHLNTTFVLNGGTINP